MMATTHTLAGVCLGLAAAWLVPVEAGPVVIAAAVGGLAPDIDLVWTHRKTLHFPVFGTLAAGIATAVSVVAFSTATVALAVALIAAAFHAVSDVIGGGLSLRPWEATSDRGVYNHLQQRWHPPRRWVRYDGAPEDAFLALALALPAYAATTGLTRTAVVGLLAVSVCYAVVRRHVVRWGQRLLVVLPSQLVRLIPETLIEDLR